MSKKAQRGLFLLAAGIFATISFLFTAVLGWALAPWPDGAVAVYGFVLASVALFGFCLGTMPED